MRGSWTTPERYVPQNLKQFDLKVGDKVIFPESLRDDGLVSLKGELHVGVVVGIYPKIFHLRYYVGINKDVPLYRSFKKIDYQLGVVTRYE